MSTGQYGWGPTGKLRTYSVTSNGVKTNYTYHWDGNSLLFVDQNSSLLQLNVGSLGEIVAGSLYVDDRDYAGFAASGHSTNGSLGWSIINGAQGAIRTTKYTSTANITDWDYTGVPTQYAGNSRLDGYSIGGLTIQGSRVYDYNSGQWSTPDSFSGHLDAPMSQRPYLWNNNNAVDRQDPSGFDPSGSDEYEEAIGDIAETVGAFAAGGAAVAGLTALFTAAGLPELAPVFAFALALPIADLGGSLAKTGIDNLYEHNATFRNLIHRIPLRLLKGFEVIAKIGSFISDKKDDLKNIFDLYKSMSVGVWISTGGTTEHGFTTRIWTFHWYAPGGAQLASSWTESALEGPQGLGGGADEILGATGPDGGTGGENDPFVQMTLHPML